MELILNYAEVIYSFIALNKIVIVSLIGGVFPALIWMLFWLREDDCVDIVDHENKRTMICSKEPRSLITVTFVLGALMVPIAYAMQKGFYIFTGASGVLLIGVWSFIEESLKYGIYYWVGVKSNYFDEPSDPLIYLTITALGFSAFENSLFLFQNLSAQTISEALIGQNMRIIGASLLHVLCSGLIGLLLGYAFLQSQKVQRIVAIIGLMFATLLHTLFNYFIISSSGAYTLYVFATVWLVGVIFLALIERLRYLSYNIQNNNQ